VDPVDRQAATLTDDGCCALGEYGHDGPCQWKHSDCGGSGRCLVCNGDGEDGSGLPDTCVECGGSGRCWGCDEGMVSDDA
jgi:hypothetical protein